MEDDMIDRMDEKILRSLIETLPAEITVLDANDEVIGWNKHEKRLFHRPMTSMGLNFRECHPKESLDKVEKIVNEMKDGSREKARFWIDMHVGSEGKMHKILIEFFALRDERGKYIGCLECTQDIEDIQHLEGQNRFMQAGIVNPVKL
jgi:PAS domain S-box-containing protein